MDIPISYSLAMLKLTHSTHHPKILARFNSSSEQFLTSNRYEFATVKPWIFLPHGTLYSFTFNVKSIRLKTLSTQIPIVFK